MPFSLRMDRTLLPTVASSSLVAGGAVVLLSVVIGCLSLGELTHITIVKIFTQTTLFPNYPEDSTRARQRRAKRHAWIARPCPILAPWTRLPPGSTLREDRTGSCSRWWGWWFCWWWLPSRWSSPAAS